MTETLLALLAVAGAVALASRAARAAAASLLRAAEVVAASCMADSSARRGDLTALDEARAIAEAARRTRRRKAFVALGYGLWLVVPLAVGLLPMGWAIAAPLWLLRRPAGRGGGRGQRMGPDF